LPATDTHSEYVILHAFHGNNGYANVPRCYVIHTFPTLLRNKKAGHGLDQCGSGLEQMAGCCEDGNETLGSIKCRVLPDQFLLTGSGICSYFASL